MGFPYLVYKRLRTVQLYLDEMFCQVWSERYVPKTLEGGHYDPFAQVGGR
jgi:hypothetical protein